MRKACDLPDFMQCARRLDKNMHRNFTGNGVILTRLVNGCNLLGSISCAAWLGQHDVGYLLPCALDDDVQIIQPVRVSDVMDTHPQSPVSVGRVE